MVINRTIGYILLVIGLAVIGWTAWQSYNIFTAKSEPPLVFKTSVSQNSSNFGLQNIQDQIQAQLEQTIQKQIGQILSASSITKTLNLIAWSMFALILIWAGGAVSGIGIKLIKS